MATLDIEKLKHILFEKKITQAEFAKKLGITPSAVSRYMVGKSFPTLATLEKMQDVLETPFTKFIVSNSPIDAQIDLPAAVVRIFLRVVFHSLIKTGLTDFQLGTFVSVMTETITSMKNQEPNEVYSFISEQYLKGLSSYLEDAIKDFYEKTYQENSTPPPSDKEKK